MDKLLQRSNGEINIELFDNNFKKFFQSGCCKILNPNNYNESNELVLINTAGGITCNDNIEINATINNSELSICTQAAEKIYAGIGDPATVEININLNNSSLYWLPKELILFDKSKLRRKININLSGNSNLIFCETSIFGRKAMSEQIKNILFSDQWKINVNSCLKHFEAINMQGSMIDNYKKLEGIQKASNEVAKKTQEMKDLHAATEAAKASLDNLTSAADDEETDEVVDDTNQDEILDEKIIIADLKKMIKVALDNGEMDLVYKIERTIDSIDDKEVVCE